MQLLVHCNGDAAAEQIVTAFRMAYQLLRNKGKPYPPRHDPCADGNKGVATADGPNGHFGFFFVAHTYYWGDIHIKNLGWGKGSAD